MEDNGIKNSEIKVPCQSFDKGDKSIRIIIQEILSLTKSKKVCNIEGDRYYGKIIIHLHDGGVDHVEVNETLK